MKRRNDNCDHYLCANSLNPERNFGPNTNSSAAKEDGEYMRCRDDRSPGFVKCSDGMYPTTDTNVKPQCFDSDGNAEEGKGCTDNGGDPNMILDIADPTG